MKAPRLPLIDEGRLARGTDSIWQKMIDLEGARLTQ